MSKPFTVGDTIAVTVRVLSRNFAPFLFLALLIHAPWVGLVLGSPVYAAVQAHEPVSPTARMIDIWLGIGIQWLSGMLVAGCFVYGTYRYLCRQPASVGDCAAQGLRSLPRVLLTSLAVGIRVLWAPGLLFAVFVFVLGATFGRRVSSPEATTLLLIGSLPIALWMVERFAQFALAVPAVVIEGAGPLTAMRRSAELTRGVRARLVGLLVLVGVFAWLVAHGCTKVLALLVDCHVIAASTMLYGSILVSIVVGLVGEVMPAAAYFRIRRSRENVDITDMANVFG